MRSLHLTINIFIMFIITNLKNVGIYLRLVGSEVIVEALTNIDGEERKPCTKSSRIELGIFALGSLVCQ